LGLWDIVGIVIGGVIGSGIFLVPAGIAAGVKAPLLILACGLSADVSFFGAVSFAEWPRPCRGGRAYVYLREAFGPLLRFFSAGRSSWSSIRGHRHADVASLRNT